MKAKESMIDAARIDDLDRKEWPWNTVEEEEDNDDQRVIFTNFFSELIRHFGPEPPKPRYIYGWILPVQCDGHSRIGSYGVNPSWVGFFANNKWVDDSFRLLICQGNKMQIVLAFHNVVYQDGVGL